jgi:glutathione S-transferase
LHHYRDTMPQYKLSYFDIRGLAEPTRMMFAHADVPYTDDRVAREDWPNRKAEMPFGQMPVLEIDGKEKIAQSQAINRYLARQFGLAGKTPIEEAKVDMIADLFKDQSNEIREYFMVAAGFKEGDKDKLCKEVLCPAVEKYGAYLEKFLEQSGSGFLVGSGPTWVDFLYADSNAKLIDMGGDSCKHTFDKFPLLKAHIHHIHELPNVKKYVETRPERKF